MKITTANITLISLVSIILFASCDPGQILKIKVDSKKQTSVTIYGYRRMLPYSIKYDSTKIIIKVPSNDTIVKTFNYGNGGWSDETITKLVAEVDSIKIITDNNIIFLKEKTEIEDYLKKHRTGKFKNLLTIETNNQ